MNAPSILPLAAAVLAGGALGQSVGSLHPDLELPTLDRSRNVRLSDYRGRKLLLIEFASW